MRAGTLFAAVFWCGIAMVPCFLACSGVEVTSGIEEPLRVQTATFKEGKLPAGASETPEITSLESQANLIRSRQVGKSVTGRASPGAVAIAIAFADLGTGYWVFPVEGPDPANKGELGWSASLDFGPHLPPGKHPLTFVALDAAGNPGKPSSLALCVDAETPDNNAACDPNAKVPAAVVSLTWDTPVDLDLIVSAPDNTFISSKKPQYGADAGAGILDRDSNSGCNIDRIQREDLVFQTAPAAGSYLVYANLFSACGSTVVHFKVTVTQAGVVTVTREGTLLAASANGGAAIGTFVTELDFQ